MAQPFDADRHALLNVPVRVAQDVNSTWDSTGTFSVSGTGVLAYRKRSASEGVQLAWLDRQGQTLSTVGSPGALVEP